MSAVCGRKHGPHIPDAMFVLARLKEKFVLI